MKPVDFPQSNVILGAEQPQYLPLPAHCSQDGTIVSCWELSKEETIELGKQCCEALSGDRACYPQVFISQLTFKQPLQPLGVALEFIPPAPVATMDLMTPVEVETGTRVAPAHRLRGGELPRSQATGNKSDLIEIADIRGLSIPLMFAMDNQSKPGSVIVHMIRLETTEFEDNAGFNETQFSTLHPDSDKRLAFLAECFTGPQKNCVINLIKVLSLHHRALSDMLKTCAVPAGMRKSLEMVLKTGDTAFETYLG